MAAAKSKRIKTAAEVSDDAHVIPGKPSFEALRSALVKSSPHEEKEITEYVNWQLSKGNKRARKRDEVQHLEVLKVERVFGRDHKVWDVHTTEGRYWVVTNPTNLYAQKDFPSADYTLSFHIGLAARMASMDRRREDAPNVDRFAVAWRRWEQGSDAIDTAHEAEDFQAIGMRCRECLVAFVRGVQADVKVPEGVEPPKAADVINWTAHLSEWVAPGEKAKDVRAYLKHLGATTWQLVNWLTHASNARLDDAELVVSATGHLLRTFSEVIMRREAKAPERCPQCSSYQIRSFYVAELESDPPYVLVCAACNWEGRPEAE